MEKGESIQRAELGLNPSSDGELVRVPIPPLTQERRKDLVKHIKKIGEEIAKTLASEGAQVVIADINLEGARQVVFEIEKHGGSAQAVKADVTRAQEVTDLITDGGFSINLPNGEYLNRFVLNIGSVVTGLEKTLESFRIRSIIFLYPQE
jgi:hypothetical protein